MGRRTIVIVIVALLTIWAMWAAQSWLLPKLFSSVPKVAERGQWGDTFGALNALLSALAFGAVLYTLWIQQQQIRDTQRDQHIQRFENSYFELLRLFREARDAVQFRYIEEYLSANNIYRDEKPASGLEAIRRANSEIIWRIKNLSGECQKMSNYRDLYEKFVYSRYESTTSPYFRILYTILFRIKNDRILSAEEKRRYGNLLRSQLSSHEAALAGYNGLSSVSKDLGSLIQEFRLLKYLPEEFGRSYLQKCYPSATFEDRPD